MRRARELKRGKEKLSRLAGARGAAERALMHERTHVMRVRRDHGGQRGVGFGHGGNFTHKFVALWRTARTICVITGAK
jgi:hypothetical protein